MADHKTENNQKKQEKKKIPKRLNGSSKIAFQTNLIQKKNCKL